MASVGEGQTVLHTSLAAKPQDCKDMAESAAAEEVSNTEPEDTVPATLSKNAQKKLLKRQRLVKRPTAAYLQHTSKGQHAQAPLCRYEDKKAARKASAKQEKHQATEQKKQDVQNLLEGMTEVDKAAWKEKRKDVRSARKAKTQEKRSRLQEVSQRYQIQ